MHWERRGQKGKYTKAISRENPRKGGTHAHNQTWEGNRRPGCQTLECLGDKRTAETQFPLASWGEGKVSCSILTQFSRLSFPPSQKERGNLVRISPTPLRSSHCSCWVCMPQILGTAQAGDQRRRTCILSLCGGGDPDITFLSLSRPSSLPVQLHLSPIAPNRLPAFLPFFYTFLMLILLFFLFIVVLLVIHCDIYKSSYNIS
jgi:hypothetical protein